MKYYVAAKWVDRDKAKSLMEKLTALGHEVTKDWTIDREDIPGYPTINAVEDIRGVWQADTFVGIFTSDAVYRGALVELGAALALRKQVIIIGKGMDSCIFISHPLVKKYSSVRSFVRSLQ